MEDVTRIPLTKQDIKTIQAIVPENRTYLTQINSLYTPNMLLVSGTVSGSASGMYPWASSSSLFPGNPGFLMNVKQRFSF